MYAIPVPHEIEYATRDRGFEHVQRAIGRVDGRDDGRRHGQEAEDAYYDALHRILVPVVRLVVVAVRAHEQYLGAGRNGRHVDLQYPGDQFVPYPQRRVARWGVSNNTVSSVHQEHENVPTEMRGGRYRSESSKRQEFETIHYPSKRVSQHRTTHQISNISITCSIRLVLHLRTCYPRAANRGAKNVIGGILQHLHRHSTSLARLRDIPHNPFPPTAKPRKYSANAQTDFICKGLQAKCGVFVKARLTNPKEFQASASCGRQSVCHPAGTGRRSAGIATRLPGATRYRPFSLKSVSENGSGAGTRVARSLKLP